MALEVRTMNKEGFAARGRKPLKLIQLDYKKTKQYNYDCNFIEHSITSNQRLDYTLEVAPSRTNLQKNFIKQSLKTFRNSLIAFLTLFALSFSACASKPLVKIETKEVFIPVKCDLELPTKPPENGSFESHKQIAIYYKKVEQIAKDCTTERKE
ncbi:MULTISPECIES: hypothetical protein [Helicobacter]|uniref:hypothetical protein n=1 Tax=Helicobacter TaxID=209 RepID=UPI0026266495|nr:hypothetical protein [Helicobacter sp. UBA3407]